mmetsp:Transcript_5787/g.8512  ORF Transcript_5787/g.8512 Transcript_5787/m.8512 type:complete len:280 (+) Transcript_5787:39-878(+)
MFDLRSFLRMAEPQEPPKPIAKFKAGRMTLKNGNVSADPQKGELEVSKNMNNEIIFKWVKRGTKGETSPVTITLKNGPATWKKVEKVNDGRVYVLEHGESPKFYWLQAADDAKDKEYENKISKALEDLPVNKAPKPETNTNTTTTTTTNNSSPEISQDQINAILNSVMANTKSNASVDLDKVLKTSTIVNILRRHKEAAMEALATHLPQGDNEPTFDELLQNVESPQFRRIVHIFNKALRSGGLGALLNEMGVSNTNNVEKLFEELEKKYGDRMQDDEE